MRARSSDRLEWLLLAAILLLAAGLRLGGIDHASLWSDEGNTWALVQRSFGEIARDAAADIHPPGYYWLLKLWSLLFGTGAAALRSFSAAAGVALVFVTYRLGSLLPNPRRASDGLAWTGLLAAFLAALNPFQIFYSQEARMYALLALESALLFWALFALLDEADRTQRWLTVPGFAFVLAGAAGLWTHYSFPVVLVAAGVTFLVDWFGRGRSGEARRRELLRFALLSALIVASFLPWLPIAVTRIRHWPQGGEAVAWRDGMELTMQTLLFGPLRDLPTPLWPWLTAAALLPLLGIASLRRDRHVVGLAVWLLAPIALMAGLGLFSDAFLKFLLIASAPWCLLVAAAAGLMRPHWLWRGGVALFALAIALLTLPDYYQSATARDNYAGVARLIAVQGDPAQDVVVLDAPGQQEVWDYYDPGLPVLALPATRPADRAATEAALAAGTDGARTVYALFWATDEADPQNIVEEWLDQHGFKGVESWQGNLRFVAYTLPQGDPICTRLEPAAAFGEVIALDEWCVAQASQPADGRALPITLHWRALDATNTRYKISVQLLDGARQVVAQHDGEPAGGSRPTDGWTPDQAITDNHGLALPPGTPPGDYRLAVAVYDPASGDRLVTSAGDLAELGDVAVVSPAEPPPPALLSMEERVNRPLGPVTLLGYDQHKLGYAHAPGTPLAAGDAVEFVFYWQAPDPLPADWPPAQTFTLALGGEQLIVPLAGSALPTVDWQPGELVRVTVRLPFDGADRRALLSVGADHIRLKRLPVE